MYIPPKPMIDTTADAGPHRRVAWAVLRQAVSDATSPLSTSARRPALEWLTRPHNDERAFWCRIAGINDEVFDRGVHRHLNQFPHDLP